MPFKEFIKEEKDKTTTYLTLSTLIQKKLMR